MNTNQLATVYGISGQRLRVLRSQGAPVETPGELLRWLQENGSQMGPLLSLLLDSAMREDLQRRIQFYCENEHQELK